MKMICFILLPFGDVELARKKLFELFETASEIANFGVLFLNLLVQALNRRQRHTVSVSTCDMFIVFADLKGGREILGHGTDAANGFLLSLVVPGCERQRHEGLENFPRVD